MSAAAIGWPNLSVGGHRVECPGCGRGPKDRTCGVTVDTRGGVAHCHRCHYVESWRDERMHRAPGSPLPPTPIGTPKRETLSPQARDDVWAAAVPLPGTIGEAYLYARNCVIPPADGDLRFHPSAWHSPQHRGPALVALLTDALERTERSLHFTWIRADGTKADVEPARRLLRGHRKAGAVCRLWPDDRVTYGLGIAEGIETALSLAHAYTPVWAAIDAGNLGAFPVTAGVESLVIAADHDEAGTKAARACGQRWADAGREVHVITPPCEGTDLNDIAREDRP